MAKITVTTDKSGRKVYKVAGTKKYAYSMAKAKEIAGAGGGTAVRKPASTGRRARHGGHGSPEEGYFDTKGRRAVRVKKVKPSAKYAAFEGELVHDVVDSLKGLASYKKAHAAFKKDAYKAAAKYGVNEDYISPSFTRKLLRELKSEIADLEGLAKSRPRVTKAYAAPASKALRRPSKGSKKYSRQKTGRALYRSRRNPSEFALGTDFSRMADEEVREEAKRRSNTMYALIDTEYKDARFGASPDAYRRASQRMFAAQASAAEAADEYMRRVGTSHRGR